MQAALRGSGTDIIMFRNNSYPLGYPAMKSPVSWLGIRTSYGSTRHGSSSKASTRPMPPVISASWCHGQTPTITPWSGWVHLALIHSRLIYYMMKHFQRRLTKVISKLKYCLPRFRACRHWQVYYSETKIRNNSRSWAFINKTRPRWWIKTPQPDLHTLWT